MALIYALIAKSNPSEIRYIGKTAGVTIKKRLYYHLYHAKNLSKLSYKDNWIRKVLAEGDEVVAIILESNLTEEQAFQQEIFLISHYSKQGHSLTNQTLGGEGLSGYVHTKEAKDKISIANTGRLMSQETKDKLSLVNKGNKRSLGFKHTQETKEKMSLSKMGNTNSLGHKQSLEQIAKRVATIKTNKDAKSLV
jgi:hypothetical protein